ncbi:MAG: hypothetical protein MJ108_01755 [Saccharofermentans sp.]|nr:hypothetical protein [Saccharofermentans sp.]
MNHNKRKFWVKLVAMILVVAMILSVIVALIAVIISMNQPPVQYIY